MIDKRPINNKEISWAAKGLLAYLLSKPNHWEIILSDLLKQSTDGRDGVRAIIKELIAAGYIVKRSFRDKGRFQTKYDVVENPTVTALPRRLYRAGETPPSNNDFSNNSTNTPDDKKPSSVMPIEDLPIEWQIKAGVSEVKITKTEKAKQMIDSANLIATTAGTARDLYYSIGMAFMLARDIVLPF
jgi:hypothetical protein